MRIWVWGAPSDEKLMVVCDTDNEATILNEFVRVDEPLVAVLKRRPGDLHPHIEIRKESL